MAKPEEKIVLEFSTDNMRGAVFSYADIPAHWFEGDHIAGLDHNAIMDVIYESADLVTDEEFEGGPGMSDTYYQVHAKDEKAFRARLSVGLIKLLEVTPTGEGGMSG